MRVWMNLSSIIFSQINNNLAQYVLDAHQIHCFSIVNDSLIVIIQPHKRF